jgi:hypothetical protein
MNYSCEICNINFSTKRRLNTHTDTDKHKIICKLFDSWKLKHKNEIKEMENKYNILKFDLELSKKHNEDKDKQIKLLQEKSEEYRKIVEKAASKSSINNNNNYTHNNYLNYISSEPLKFKDIKEQAKKYINSVSVMYDDEDFHDHIVDNILKDKNGKDKVLCTDINRKNFTYKDETSGKMIFDPELERLREQLKKGTDIKQLRLHLLEQLVSEYEENGCTGQDPYKKFSDIIQKLNFGNPFVDHVAKKTYVKRCQSIENGKLENVIQGTNKLENKNSFEYKEQMSISEETSCDTDEEYKQLLKEFGDEDGMIIDE